MRWSQHRHDECRKSSQGSSWSTRAAGEFGLRFSKYSAFGNTFVIVDETQDPLRSNRDRESLARWALDDHFGIGGSDNVLYLQLPEGASASGRQDADFVFRIFEFDGSETLTCGNGLLCVAAMLNSTHAESQWRILTEVPSGDPKVVTVGVGSGPGEVWANIGWPRVTPARLFRRCGAPPTSTVETVRDISMPLPRVARGLLPRQLVLSGSVVFNGEPHLVLISGRDFPSELDEWLYVPGEGFEEHLLRPRRSLGSALVDHIGRHINDVHRELFPEGVHVSFARIRDSRGVIEYRTYERAIDRETLACGTGAAAVTYVARKADLVPQEVDLWPIRCRWYEPNAAQKIQESPSGLVLKGTPRRLYEGLASWHPDAMANVRGRAE